MGEPVVAMKVRKQIYDLTLDDLTRFPVWEFALDEEGEEGQDEATVRPVIMSGAPDPAESMFIVRAQFTLADGSKEFGYLTTPSKGDEGLGRLQPVIVTKKGQVLFWHGILAPKAAALAQAYEKLDRKAADIFPLNAKSDVDLEGPPVQFTIPGFMILEDWKTGKTRHVA